MHEWTRAGIRRAAGMTVRFGGFARPTSRARIIAGAAELARELPSWDWGTLTIQAVADHAGVSRRTVYRHFASQAVLHGCLS